MTPNDSRPDQRKDLQDFVGLSHAPIVAYLQKQALPRMPRQKGAGALPSIFQKMKIFLPNNQWRWLSEYLRCRIGRKHPFLCYEDPERDNGIYRLEGDGEHDADEIRIALAGDWGTGTDEAFMVAERIKSFDPHYAIHLGDVYFVGDPTEVRENFLGIPNPQHAYKPCVWPRGSRGTFSLNANHEMYARGYGYFPLMLPELGLSIHGRPQGQKASFFCLENQYWRLVALDTGYRSINIPIIEDIPFFSPDCALPGPLMAWLRESVFRPEDKRGIILLGHHQYCSCFQAGYTRQAEQLAEFIQRPVLWFWGHEHRLAIYEKFQTGKGITAFGRCIGHGGMPIALPPDQVIHPECQAEFLDYRPYPNDENLKIGFNGFARLTFRRETLTVEYVDLNDTVLFEESWKIEEGGALERTAASDAPLRKPQAMPIS